MYRRQLIAIDEMVVMMPIPVLHQPTVIRMEDGHNIALRSVFPTVIILHTPCLQRRKSTVPGTISAVVQAMIAVCLMLIGFDFRSEHQCPQSYVSRDGSTQTHTGWRQARCMLQGQL